MNNLSSLEKLTKSQNTMFSLKEAQKRKWESIKKKSQNNSSRANILARKFLALVETNFKEHHPLMFYASRLNISKNYLGKICRQSVGHSPSHCIQVRLINEACDMLNAQNLSIKEISSNLGFADPAYFTRFFKKQGGLPPEAFRNIALNLKMA